jgi:hypothetical protein
MQSTDSSSSCSIHRNRSRVCTRVPGFCSGSCTRGGAHWPTCFYSCTVRSLLWVRWLEQLETKKKVMLFSDGPSIFHLHQTFKTNTRHTTPLAPRPHVSHKQRQTKKLARYWLQGLGPIVRGSLFLGSLSLHYTTLHRPTKLLPCFSASVAHLLHRSSRIADSQVPRSTRQHVTLIRLPRRRVT